MNRDYKEGVSDRPSEQHYEKACQIDLVNRDYEEGISDRSSEQHYEEGVSNYR